VPVQSSGPTIEKEDNWWAWVAQFRGEEEDSLQESREQLSYEGPGATSGLPTPSPMKHDMVQDRNDVEHIW
jgi:hypothetical protein